MVSHLITEQKELKEKISEQEKMLEGHIGNTTIDSNVNLGSVKSQMSEHDPSDSSIRNKSSREFVIRNSSRSGSRKRATNSSMKVNEQGS